MRDNIKSDHKSTDTANGDRLVCQGEGNVKVIIDGHVQKTITNIMHVSDISVNFLSVSKTPEKSFILICDKHECRVYKESDVIMKSMCNFRVGKVKDFIS